MTKDTAVVQAETVAPFPPKIAEAINGVMKQVPKLNKGEKNDHGKYNFTSIDDFLEAVGPLCAQHGLIIIPDEESSEVISGGQPGKEFLVFVFTFRLVHSSGEMWSDKVKRSSYVRLSNGPQATGIAQSYALKNFERSLFQIATGDVQEDVDAQPNESLPAQQRRTASGPLTLTELRKFMHSFSADLAACTDLEMFEALRATTVPFKDQEFPVKDVLAQVMRDFTDHWRGTPDYQGLKADIESKKVQLEREAQQAAEMPNDPADREAAE